MLKLVATLSGTGLNSSTLQITQKEHRPHVGIQIYYPWRSHPLLPENSRKGVFFSGTMGEFCAVWVMAVPMGVSRLKSSGGCVPAWISEEHIEIKSTDSIVCLLKRCVTHKEKSQAAFQVSQQCQRINIRPRLQWGASYDAPLWKWPLTSSVLIVYV